MRQDSFLDAARHYDLVTEAWTFLLGDELHYGLFATGEESLASATAALTHLVIDELALAPGKEVLDIGCGTGAQACRLGREHHVRVIGITTSARGIEAARARAQREGVADTVSFEQRDGTDNRFADAAFDRALSLESSHLMRKRERLLAETSRVLTSGGRLVLCDIVLRRHLSLAEVRQLREPLVLLRDVFGDAHMESLERYVELARQQGLSIETTLDLTSATRPTFARWRENARRYRSEVTRLIGEERWRQFVEACTVLERFWDEGILGYGLLVARKNDSLKR